MGCSRQRIQAYSARGDERRRREVGAGDAGVREQVRDSHAANSVARAAPGGPATRAPQMAHTARSSQKNGSMPSRARNSVRRYCAPSPSSARPSSYIDALPEAARAAQVRQRAPTRCARSGGCCASYRYVARAEPLHPRRERRGLVPRLAEDRIRRDDRDGRQACDEGGGSAPPPSTHHERARRGAHVRCCRSARLGDRGRERRVALLVQRVELHVAPRDLAVLADRRTRCGSRPAGRHAREPYASAIVSCGSETSAKGNFISDAHDTWLAMLSAETGSTTTSSTEQRRVLIAELRQLGGASARAVLRVERDHDDLAAKAREAHRRSTRTRAVGPLGGEVGRGLADFRAGGDDGRGRRLRPSGHARRTAPHRRAARREGRGT